MKKKESGYIRDGRNPVPLKEATSRVMSAIRGRDTKPEMMLRKALWDSGVRGYRLCWKKAPGSPDIAFPSRRLAIFVHGCYWHRCPYCQPDVPKQHSLFWAQKFAANQERDLRKNKQLGDQGWRVVTIWECQVKQGLTQQIELIINVLRYG